MLYDRAELVDQLDDVSRQFVWSHGYCERCGVRSGLTNSHIKSRSHFLVRWDPRNLQCICMDCHRFLQGNPNYFGEWVESSSCGEYLGTIFLQARMMVKPDLLLWKHVYEIILGSGFSLVESRLWLGDKVVLFEKDLA